MKLNKVQLKDGRWVEQYMRDACDRCVLNDDGSCQHGQHPKLAGIDCSQRQWRFCGPESETLKKKTYPKPEDCIKIPCETCVGCVFGDLHQPEGCNHPNRDHSSECGSFSNPKSMIYVLKSSAEVKASSWDNGIHYMIAMSGCTGCCFNDHCSAKKPDGYPECNSTGSPLKVSSQFRAHENPCSETTKPEFEEEEVEEDPENLDNEYELDKGGVVRGVREPSKGSCDGCFFYKEDGDCNKSDMLEDDDPNCAGIVFACIEDPPEKVVDEKEDDADVTKIGQIVTDKYGDHYKAFEYEGTCRGCAFNDGAGDCVLTNYFRDEPDCGSVIFKRVDDEGNLHNPDDDDDDDEEVPDEAQVAIGDTIFVEGNFYVNTKDPRGIDAITGCEACDLTGDLCPGPLERCMISSHFKLIAGSHDKIDTVQLIFKKEVKFNL
jgi:hypothetical protein